MAASAKAKNPGSWNRYSYTLGDPVNNSDPSGMDLPGPNDPSDPGLGGPLGWMDPCSQITLGLAWGSDPDDPSGYGSVLAAIACGQLGGYPMYPPTSSVPPPETCSVSLYTQSAGFQGNPFQHTFIQIGIDVDGTISDEDLEAGPSSGFSGYLNNLNDVPNGPNTYPTTPSRLFTTGYSSSECSAVGKLDALAAEYPQNTYPYFKPYNSNSFTYTLLTDAGVSIPISASAYLLSPPIIVLPIPRAPGWGWLIPSWP
jgi:hypothetical protein